MLHCIAFAGDYISQCTTFSDSLSSSLQAVIDYLQVTSSVFLYQRYIQYNINYSTIQLVQISYFLKYIPKELLIEKEEMAQEIMKQGYFQG